MKIVVDGFGGDNAPEEIVQGALDALEMYDNISLVITGDENVLNSLVSESKHRNRIEIVDAPEIITNDDVPTQAIRTKKRSSLVVALERAKEDEEVIGVISAGSTGAVLTGAVLKLGRMKGLLRPALCPALPTMDGGSVYLIDCGANVDCRPEMLVQFAHMGSAYCNVASKIENPKVALLSNGTEDKKGSELTKEVFSLLKADENINFVGNMEGRDILSGKYDVVVCDGFNGNIALKTCEGTATTLLKMIKNEIKASPMRMFGALFLKGAFKSIKSRMDYNSGGGALFVGCSKVLLKCHGAAHPNSVCGAIGQVLSINEGNLTGKIQDYLASTITETAENG